MEEDLLAVIGADEAESLFLVVELDLAGGHRMNLAHVCRRAETTAPSTAQSIAGTPESGPSGLFWEGERFRTHHRQSRRTRPGVHVRGHRRPVHHLLLRRDDRHDLRRRRRRDGLGGLGGRHDAALVRAADRLPAPHRPAHRQRRSAWPSRAIRIELIGDDARARRTTPRAVARRPRRSAALARVRAVGGARPLRPRRGGARARLDRPRRRPTRPATPRRARRGRRTGRQPATPRSTACATSSCGIAASAELSDAAGDLLDDLSGLMLLVRIDDRVHVPTAVIARVGPRLGAELPTVAELATPAPPVLVSGDDVDRTLIDRRAAESAYATVAATAEVLAALGTQPARELAKGGLALPDSKRLAEASGIALDELPRLFHRADEAGLVVRDGAFWLESERGAEWSLESTAGRWRRLAECWRDRIPEALRELVARRSESLTASTLGEDVRWFYPAGGRWIDEGLERLIGEAEALGLAVAGEPAPTALLVLAGRARPGRRAAGGAFPRPGRAGLPAARPLDRLARPARADARRAPPRIRRRRGPRPRVDLSRQRGIRQSRHSPPARRPSRSSSSSAGSRSPASPSRSSYLVGEAAARFGSLRVCARRRSGCPGAARACAPTTSSSCAPSPSTSRSSSIGLRQVGPHRLLSRFAARRRVLGALRRPLPRRRRRRRRARSSGCAATAWRTVPEPAVEGRPDRGAARRRARRGRRRGDRAGVARPPARGGGPLEGDAHGHGAHAGRRHRRLPAGAGERRQRPTARARPQGRHRTHAAPVGDRRGRPPAAPDARRRRPAASAARA